jgi:hypothetical protein
LEVSVEWAESDPFAVGDDDEERSSSPRAECSAHADTSEILDSLIERGVVREIVGCHGLGTVRRDVPKDRGSRADQLEMDDVGIRGDGFPGERQVTLGDESALGDCVDVRVPAVLEGIVLNLDESNAAVDAIEPQFRAEEAAESVL